jgi:hypothetical protein
LKSWEVLHEATQRVGVKALAARLRLSAALIYKWCQEAQQDDPDSSGTRNPLDRVRVIYEVTGDPRVVNWLCSAAGGFFVQNPQADPRGQDAHLLESTQRVVEEFGELLSAVSRSYENDGRVSIDEADHIRQSWEDLKTQAEQFVVACERGLFDRPDGRGQDAPPGRG